MKNLYFFKSFKESLTTTDDAIFSLHTLTDNIKILSIPGNNQTPGGNMNSTIQYYKSYFFSAFQGFLNNMSDIGLKLYLSRYYSTVDFFSGNKTIWYNITDNRDIVIKASNSVIIKSNVYIIAVDNASITLKSGTQGNGKGTVKIEGRDQQICLDKGALTIYYNPGPINTPKYTNPYFYEKHACKDSVVKSYMWINNVYDLQNIRTYIAGNYALSKNISSTKEIDKINNGTGFLPIFIPWKQSPFVGEFDGLGHSINNLKITCGETNVKNPAYGGCGIFGRISNGAFIHNVIIKNCFVKGDHYVGILFGTGTDSTIDNITIINSTSQGNDVLGVVGGTALFVNMSNIYLFDNNYTCHPNATYCGPSSTYCGGEMIGTCVNYPTEELW